MNTTITDQITDMTYDEAKDYLLNLGQRGLGLCYQRFPKPPSWSQSLTHYDRLAANLRSGAALSDTPDDRRDALVLENLFGCRIEWIDDRQGKLGTWGDERVQLFENPVLTSAFKTLMKMWRAYWLLTEEIRCHEYPTNIEIDPLARAFVMAQEALCRAEWPDAEARLRLVSDYLVQLAPTATNLEETCAEPDRLQAAITAARRVLAACPPLPWFLAPKFSDREHSRRNWERLRSQAMTRAGTRT